MDEDLKCVDLTLCTTDLDHSGSNCTKIERILVDYLTE